MLGVDLERLELARASATASSQNTSRPSCIGTSPPSRRQTTTCSTDGDSASASSTIAFIGTSRPRRSEPSAVTTTFASECRAAGATAGAAKPEKTGTWTAPRCAQACEAIATSRRHRQEDRHAVAGSRRRAPRAPRRSRVTSSRELGVGERRALPVLALPDGRLRAGPLAARPAVHAVPGEVELRRRRTRSPTRARATRRERAPTAARTRARGPRPPPARTARAPRPRGGRAPSSRRIRAAARAASRWPAREPRRSAARSRPRGQA